MKRDHLGDSYDAVKRFWQQALAGWAPLYAEPRFIPPDLRHDFTRLTGIPMLPEKTPSRYSILNDPDTGIRLPGEDNQRESQSHIALNTICDQLRRHTPRVVITFDQSHYRNHTLEGDEQRLAKLKHLEAMGLFAFYYKSHAPFLFAFSNAESCRQLRKHLLELGIPDTRLETFGILLLRVEARGRRSRPRV